MSLGLLRRGTKLSHRHNATGGWSATQRTRHLQVYQNHRGPNLLVEPPEQLLSRPPFSLTFHIFPSLSSGAGPSSCPRRWKEIALVWRSGCWGWRGGGEVMSSLPPYEGLALLKWNSLVLSDRAMEAGKTEEMQPPRDLRPPPPLASVLLASILHFHLSPSLYIFLPPPPPPPLLCSPRHRRRPRTGRSINGASRDPCPEAFRWLAKYRVRIIRGTKGALPTAEEKKRKTHHERARTSAKCV